MGTKPAVRVTNNDFNVLAAAAHDFKSPLALIYGLASELSHENDPEFIAKSATDIAAASERLMQMIDTVSLAHHATQTEFELDLSPVDMRAAVNQAAYDATSLAEVYEHPLNVRISRRLPTVMGHKASVQRIIASLLDTTIRSGASQQVIDLVVRKVGEDVVLSVTDASTGIKPREWKRIITQSGGARQPSPALGDSSGVSLYAIKQLATAMNGEFKTHVSSKGAVFMLRLPQVAQLRLF